VNLYGELSKGNVLEPGQDFQNMIAWIEKMNRIKNVSKFSILFMP